MILYSNNAQTTIAGSISNTATSVTLSTGAGVNFPSPGTGQYFSLTHINSTTGLPDEIAYCTAKSGDVLTIVRGKEGTTAVAWTSGDTVANFLTASGLESFAQLSNSANPIVGDSRNVAMTVSAASATATLTADEIIVKTALGAYGQTVSGINNTINLAATGPGGMDTGTAPANGFVAIYVIAYVDPIALTITKALLAVNATSAAAPEIYGGANMPTGYTMSALVSVWPTNASGQFVIGNQNERSIAIATAVILNWGAFTALSNVSLNGLSPLNTKSIKGYLLASVNASSANGTATLQVGKDANFTGSQYAIASADTVGATYPNTSNFNLDIKNNQLYAAFINGGITGATFLSAAAYITEYSI